MLAAGDARDGMISTASTPTENALAMTSRVKKGSSAARWVASRDVPSSASRAEAIGKARKVASDQFGVELRDWQAEAIADIYSKKDVIVSAGTGSGKSMIFQSLPFMTADGIILVISPLLSLMHDQVTDFLIIMGEIYSQKQVTPLVNKGISAVAITADEIRNNPEIWKEVERGVYRIVYASPEVLLRPGSYFWIHLVRKKCAFNTRLIGVAIDEVHVVWGYRE